MASGGVHSVVGFGVGVALAAHEGKQSEGGQPPLGLLTCGGLAAFATRLPDVLEPAIHPHHRQFFHSIAFAALVGKLSYDAYRWQPETDGQELVRHLLILAGSAYLAHLALDLGTARGLPLIGK